jgi:hypothetical protein
MGTDWYFERRALYFAAPISTNDSTERRSLLPNSDSAWNSPKAAIDPHPLKGSKMSNISSKAASGASTASALSNSATTAAGGALSVSAMEGQMTENANQQMEIALLQSQLELAKTAAGAVRDVSNKA